MTSEIGKSLLPIGEELDFNGRALQINKYIGEGFTGVVYEGSLEVLDAPVRVAVKAMKPLDIPEAVERFKQEGITLTFLMEMEKEANKRQQIPLKIAPVYYGMSKYDDTDYIVMEFVEGIQLPDLLVREHHLSEEDALTIAWHFYRILDILHSQIHESFVDLKLENLWWVEDKDKQNGHLKITDLGTLAEIKPGAHSFSGVERDLLLAAIILFNLLTGYLLRYSIYGLKERVAPLIRKFPMSWGTQRILYRALHRNPDRRYKNAADIEEELNTLVNFWGYSDERLYDIANENLIEASKKKISNQESNKLARRARSALGVIETRQTAFNPTGVQRAIDQAENILSKGDFLRIGIDLFMGGSYQDALDNFNEGKDWSDDPAVYRRWGYLTSAMMGTHIPAELFEEKREETKQALDMMNEGFWDAAKQRWESLSDYLNPNGLNALIADCDLFENMGLAEKAKGEDHFGKAAQHYKLALDLLQLLPDSDFVKKVELGDLLRMSEKMTWLQNTRGEAKQAFIDGHQLMADKEIDKAITRFNDAFSHDPEYPKLAQELQRASDQALQGMNFRASLQILYFGMKSPTVSKQLAGSWRMVQNLSIVQGAFEARDYDRFVNASRTTIVENKENVFAITAVKSMLLEAVDTATQMNRSDLLLDIHALILLLPGAESIWADQVRAKADSLQFVQNQEKKNTIDRNLTLATCLIYLGDPEWAGGTADIMPIIEIEKNFANRKTSLLKANQLLGDASIIGYSIGYRGDKIEELKTRVAQKLQELPELSEGYQKTYEHTSQEIKGEITYRLEHFQNLHKWNVQGIQFGLDYEIQNVINRQLESDLTQIIILAHQYLSRIDQDDEYVNQILEQVTQKLNRFGVNGWQSLSEIANQNISQIQSESDQAKTYLRNGNLDEASAKIDRLLKSYPTSKDLIELKKNVIQTINFREWQDLHKEALSQGKPNSELVKQINSYIDTSIARFYWINSATINYLIAAKQNARLAVQQNFKSPEKPIFIERIRQWVELEKTLARLQIS